MRLKEALLELAQYERHGADMTAERLLKELEGIGKKGRDGRTEEKGEGRCDKIIYRCDENVRRPLRGSRSIKSRHVLKKDVVSSAPVRVAV